jgi:hypothetical protein
VKFAWLVVLAACGPGLAAVDPKNATRRALLAAVDDPGEIEELLDGEVVNGGLWFTEPACRAQFPQPEVIQPPRFGAFARCVAGLHLRPSERQHRLGDVEVMTYAPGFEVEVRVVREVAKPRLLWIGYESRQASEAVLPTITADALEGLRVSGDRGGPLAPEVAAQLELDVLPVPVAMTWLKVCLDAAGAVTSVHPHETTSWRAQQAFEAAARGWTFRPFTVAGQAIPACAMVRMAYPLAAAPKVEMVPMPPPSGPGPAPIVFFQAASPFGKARRIAGNKFVVPSDEIKDELAKRRGVSRLEGTFRVCLDATGHVAQALPARSTGFAAYDREILSTLRSWVYEPVVVDGAPAAVCTLVTFVYTQH